jgi:dTDP-4-dehydrorhamnose reductase
MQRLLITGGSGYLGTELVRQAPTHGWTAAATFRSPPPPIPDVTFLRLDIRDADEVARVVAEARPDVIIHTAYVQSGPDLWPVTAEGAAVVARAAQAAGARLVHMSSDVIFDGERNGLYTEEDQPQPISDYGRAKADAEQSVAALHPQALIVRTSLIYGGTTLSKHEQLALDAADGKAPITFFTDELRCPVVVEDLAAALLELAAGDASGRLNVAGADTVSRYTFAQLVAAAHGRDPERISGATSPPEARRPRNCALDSSRAQQMITTRLRGAHEFLRTTRHTTGAGER